MAICSVDGKEEHWCFAGSELDLRLLVLDVQVDIFIHDGSCVGDSWSMILSGLY